MRRFPGRVLGYCYVNPGYQRDALEEIMIVDVNAYLGHFAFRRLRHNSAAALMALMDSKRIDKAVVSSAGAITYRTWTEACANWIRHQGFLVVERVI